MKEDHRCITSQPEDGCIDIPHTPDSEAALLQETRERLAMLERHVAHPERVKELKYMDKVLEHMVHSLTETPEYKCECIENSNLLNE